MGSILSQELMDFGLSGRKELFVPCKDEKNQESLRAMLFFARRQLEKKFPGIAKKITISKSKQGDKLFVCLAKRPQIIFYEKDQETGELIPIKQEQEKGIRPDLERRFKQMREDGLSRKEIEENFSPVLATGEIILKQLQELFLEED